MVLTLLDADMSLKSGSGVQGLRAMFEQSNNETSPPSRGRSPAGDSTTSNPSRPISKVRASFVSVDRSGAGLLPESRKASMNGSRPAMDGTQDEKPLNGSSDAPSVNGDRKVSSGPTSDPFIDSPRSTPSKDAAPLPQPGATRAVEPGLENTSHAEKSDTAAEEAPSKLYPGDPTSSQAVSGGRALSSDAPGLGLILKGSPFLEDAKEATELKENDTQVAPAAATPSSAKQPKPVVSKVQPNGKPSTKPKEPASPTKNKSTPNAQVEKPKINAIKPTSQKASIKSPKTPQSPKEIPGDLQKPKPKSTITNQSRSAAVRPKTEAPQPAMKMSSAKGSEKAVEKPTTITNVPPTRTSKPPSTTTTAKPPVHTVPPKQAFTKPRPKSPTRPTRLPASATAPTAASAAKLDSDGSKPPTVAAPQPKTTSHIRMKPPRASLPARSAQISERPTKSQPRASIAGSTMSRGGEEGFLARMMRPTQASKSKVHDKVEVKSPPRPTAGNKAGKVKRVSEGSETDKGGLAENGTTIPTEQGAAAANTARVEENKDEKIAGSADKPAAPGANAAESKPPSVAALSPCD